MKNIGRACVVEVGDVIDLTDADVTYSKAEKSENLRIVIRNQMRSGFITIFAGKEAIGFKRAKIVSISKVVMTARKFNQWITKNFTNVYATLEETDEMPTLIAENGIPKTNITDKSEWVRPEWKGE